MLKIYLTMNEDPELFSLQRGGVIAGKVAIFSKFYQPHVEITCTLAQIVMR